MEIRRGTSPLDRCRSCDFFLLVNAVTASIVLGVYGAWKRLVCSGGSWSGFSSLSAPPCVSSSSRLWSEVSVAEGGRMDRRCFRDPALAIIPLRGGAGELSHCLRFSDDWNEESESISRDGVCDSSGGSTSEAIGEGSRGLSPIIE